MRFALDNDALRRGVAVAIRRGRRVRRGYKKEQRSCEKTWYYYSLLSATEVDRMTSEKSHVCRTC